MILLVLFIFVIYGVFHRAVDLAATFQNALDLLLTVMQRFQMEPIIIASVHRIQNGDQTADGIVHRRQEFTVLGGIDAAFQILASMLLRRSVWSKSLLSLHRTFSGVV